MMYFYLWITKEYDAGRINVVSKHPQSFIKVEDALLEARNLMYKTDDGIVHVDIKQGEE